MVTEDDFTSHESLSHWSHAWLQDIESPAEGGASPSSSRQRLWDAAVEADLHGVPAHSLADVWIDLARGRLRAWWESIGPDRILLVARMTAARVAMTGHEESIVARVLHGDQQKLLASELSIAPSTVSGRFVRALGKLDLIPRCVPVPLVLAAQTFAGLNPGPRAR